MPNFGGRRRFLFNRHFFAPVQIEYSVHWPAAAEGMEIMKNKWLSYIGKGFVTGASMLVPGVSGGTMAMLLDIYDELISAVSSFLDDKKENSALLLLFTLGGLGGMLLLARPILWLTRTFPFPMLYFFMGVVTGGVPMICAKAGVHKISVKSMAYPAFGMLAVILLGRVSGGLGLYQLSSGFGAVLCLIAAGAAAAAALVLPGISVSYLLLLLGMYEPTMEALAQMYLPYLLPLAAGGLLGIALTTRLLERCMNRHPEVTYLLILGFILGSVMEIFPGIPTGFQLFLCPAMFLGGCLLTGCMAKLRGPGQGETITNPDMGE